MIEFLLHHDPETMTSSTTMTFNETLQPRDVLNRLNAQRSDTASCDVIIRSSSSETTSSVHAHRCILAASSDYFNALFRHDLTDVKVVEAVIPGSSHDIIETVVTFMYTGAIEVSEGTVVEIVRLADYLGLPKVLELCGNFMKRNLRDSTCLKFKVLSDLHPLGTLSDHVQNYILPRMSTLVRRSDTVDLPVDALRQLLSDNLTNYAREADVLKLVQDLVASRADMDSTEREKARDLLDCVEFEYLSPGVIERRVLSNSDALDWLNERPELLERVRGFGERNQESGRDVVEVILCRGRASKTGDDLQVMLYLVRDDEWRVLRQPRDEKGSGLWPGLEAMITHDGFLYALSSRMEDMNGYMHPAKETKFFNRLNLMTGAWFVLPPPRLVTGQTMLVSALQDCVLAIDSTGRVERYVIAESQWTDHCCVGFPGVSNGTLCFLPMPKGDELFVLRSYSAGYSFYYSQRSLSIYRMDAVTNDVDGGGHSWNELTQVEIADLFVTGEDVNFFGYSIAPGLISLKDELGHTRAQFDTTEAKWTTLPMRVPRPGFIREIFGSAACASRVYFVACAAINSDSLFAMFDNARGRFKMTQAPPHAVSGLLCHVTLPTAAIESVCKEN